MRGEEAVLPPLAAGAVIVPPDMRALLQGMWRGSPTFRRQCARLVDESVTVRVRLVGPSAELGFAAARSRITTERGRVTSVEVRLASTVDLAYLAHEIEHVLEQVDGVDFRSATAQGVHGVESNRAGMFETTRAIAIKNLVARDLGMQPRLPKDPRNTWVPPRVGEPRKR